MIDLAGVVAYAISIERIPAGEVKAITGISHVCIY
jgi:hypothetical protein